MAQIIQFLINLFKKYVPEYRIVKETRAVKETADGQNLTLQAFYYVQVKEKRRGEWKRAEFYVFRPASFDCDTYCYGYPENDEEYETEELAKQALKCATYKEDYRGYKIRMAMFKDFGKNKRIHAVYFATNSKNEYSYRTFKTRDEAVEYVNSLKPQVVNIETI